MAQLPPGVVARMPGAATQRPGAVGSPSPPANQPTPVPPGDGGPSGGTALARGIATSLAGASRNPIAGAIVWILLAIGVIIFGVAAIVLFQQFSARVRQQETTERTDIRQSERTERTSEKETGKTDRTGLRAEASLGKVETKAKTRLGKKKANEEGKTSRLDTKLEPRLMKECRRGCRRNIFSPVDQDCFNKCVKRLGLED